MERNSPLQEVASKRGWASALPCPLLAAQKMPEKGGQSWACMGQGAPWTTQGWSPLRCGCSCPVESVEVWVASDLQCKVQAAMEAAFLNNAVTWKAFLISSSSSPPLFSAEKISWVLLCALHHLGCSWQPHSQEPGGDGSPQAWVWIHLTLAPAWGAVPFMGTWHCHVQPYIYPAANSVFFSISTLSSSLRDSALLRLCRWRGLYMLKLMLIYVLLFLYLFLSTY